MSWGLISTFYLNNSSIDLPECILILSLFLAACYWTFFFTLARECHMPFNPYIYIYIKKLNTHVTRFLKVKRVIGSELVCLHHLLHLHWLGFIQDFSLGCGTYIFRMGGGGAEKFQGIPPLCMTPTLVCMTPTLVRSHWLWFHWYKPSLFITTSKTTWRGLEVCHEPHKM